MAAESGTPCPVRTVFTSVLAVVGVLRPVVPAMLVKLR